MEGKQQCSPQFGKLVHDDDDVQNVSGLSTLLVATIQDAKDRLSQIEYVFCNQLHPTFQSESKRFEKVHLGYKRNEEAWREKEKELLLQIQTVQLEKKESLEKNWFLEQDNVKLLAKVSKLEQELTKKSRELDEGMELQNKLVKMVQEKNYLILDKKKQLKEHEEKIKEQLAKIMILERSVEELEHGIRKKTEEIANNDEIQNETVKKINALNSKLAKSGKLLAEHEEEKKNIAYKLGCLEENVRELHEQLEEKEEESKLNDTKFLKQKQLLENSENEKTMLQNKFRCLEGIVNQQKQNPSSSSNTDAGQDLYEMLLQQIELKKSQLQEEKKKKRDVIDAYKRLKSQYNFLCSKKGLTTENMLPLNMLEDGKSSLENQKSPTTSIAAFELKKVKIENGSDVGEDHKVVKQIPVSNFHSPPLNHTVSKCPASVKSAPAAGMKRPASSWIETRSHQGKDGPDPHDDFLNTPLENLRGNLNKAMREEASNLSVDGQTDMNSDCSDDETQNVNVGPSPQKQLIPNLMSGKNGFKYVEPVRKKTDRENLKGVQCRQCEKFYDAVLPGNGGKDAEANKQNFRCEHHEGVSRHRYKYLPPMTPEGFWNIGFESEL